MNTRARGVKMYGACTQSVKAPGFYQTFDTLMQFF